VAPSAQPVALVRLIVVMGESRPRGTDEEELRNAREVSNFEINGH
jgi:hypothetical protein